MLRLRFAGSLGLALGLAAIGCGGESDDTPVGGFVVDSGQPAVTADSGQSGAPEGGLFNPGGGTGSAGGTGSDAGSVGGGTGSVGGGDAGANKPDTGTPDAGGMGDGGQSGDAGPDSGAPRLKPKCVKKDSQVMIIGDSYINWISHKFPEQIKAASKQDWRMLAVGGTSMGSGGIGSIPAQFDEGIKADPDAHTVLMDGGGNDILVADWGQDFFGVCKDTGSSKNPTCQGIVKTALDAADGLMKRAQAAGIRDVVYFFYPYVPENRLIGGPHPNEILDYSLPMVRDFCNSTEAKTNGKLRCHFIDMVPVFKDHTPEIPGSTVTAGSEADWFNGDIHPNEKGSQGQVDAIWKLMVERCIGQKDKDCCEP